MGSCAFCCGGTASKMEMVPVSLPRFEDYSYLEDHRTPTDGARKAKWLKHREIAWDNTTRKYTPMMLKGYRPITLEPYACCTALADTALSRTHPALLRASQASRKLHASECEIRRDAADCVWLPAAPRVRAPGGLMTPSASGRSDLSVLIHGARARHGRRRRPRCSPSSSTRYNATTTGASSASGSRACCKRQTSIGCLGHDRAGAEPIQRAVCGAGGR